MLRKISYRILWMICATVFATDAMAQENAFQRGYQAYQQKDYLGAVAALKGAPLPPKHPLKDYERWALGVAMIETNDPKSAIPVLEALSRDEPDSIWANAARVQSGRAWLAAGDPKKAVEILQLAAKDPNPDWQGEALYYLGEAETTQGEKSAAVAHWRDAYLKDPGSSVEQDLLARLQSNAARRLFRSRAHQPRTQVIRCEALHGGPHHPGTAISPKRRAEPRPRHQGRMPLPKQELWRCYPLFVGGGRRSARGASQAGAAPFGHQPIAFPERGASDHHFGKSSAAIFRYRRRRGSLVPYRHDSRRSGPDRRRGVRDAPTCG